MSYDLKPVDAAGKFNIDQSGNNMFPINLGVNDPLTNTCTFGKFVCKRCSINSQTEYCLDMHDQLVHHVIHLNKCETVVCEVGNCKERFSSVANLNTYMDKPHENSDVNLKRESAGFYGEYPQDKRGAYDLRMKKTNYPQRGKVQVNTHNMEPGVTARPLQEHLVVEVDFPIHSSCLEVNLKVSPSAMGHPCVTRSTQSSYPEQISMYKKPGKYESGTSTSDKNVLLAKEEYSRLAVPDKKKCHSDKPELSQEGLPEGVRNSGYANSEQQSGGDVNNRNGPPHSTAPEIIERSTKRSYDNIGGGGDEQCCHKVLKVLLKKVPLTDDGIALFKEADINSKETAQKWLATDLPDGLQPGGSKKARVGKPAFSKEKEPLDTRVSHQGRNSCYITRVLRNSYIFANYNIKGEGSWIQ